MGGPGDDPYHIFFRACAPQFDLETCHLTPGRLRSRIRSSPWPWNYNKVRTVRLPPIQLHWLCCWLWGWLLCVHDQRTLWFIITTHCTSQYHWKYHSWFHMKSSLISWMMGLQWFYIQVSKVVNMGFAIWVSHTHTHSTYYIVKTHSHTYRLDLVYIQLTFSLGYQSLTWIS